MLQLTFTTRSVFLSNWFAMVRTSVDQIALDIKSLSFNEIESLAEVLFLISPLAANKLQEQIKVQYELRALDFSKTNKYN